MKSPTCSCSGCQCGAAQDLKQEREKEKVYQFLWGLDDVVFGTKHTSPPARTLNERADAVSLRLKPHLTQNLGRPEEVTEGHAPFVESMVMKLMPAFQIVGYPDWWISGKNGRGAGRGKTWRTHKVTTGGGMQTGGVADEHGSFPGLSTDQWSALMNILNSHKPTSSTEKPTGKQDRTSRAVIGMGEQQNGVIIFERCPLCSLQGKWS
ncbi:hypothetical protein SESBI_20237 [Sesbania bispinosa]|nr:hypothetical protein SESBI_20237 [Sesbania bispinosa]